MRSDELKQALGTVAAIPVVPFTPEGAIDLPRYERLVGRLTEGGVSVVTANGSTGEFYSLRPVEWRSVVEATVAAATDRTVVVTGVGHDLQTAIELGRFATNAGAAAVMVHQPVHPFQSANGWVAYHAAIAEAIPEAGIVPYVRDPGVTTDMVARLAAYDNVVGIKYAVPDPLRFAAMVAAIGADRLAWICGLAEGWAPFFWPGGAIGFTSGLVNVDPGLPLAMLASLQAGDRAGTMALWQRMQPFEELRARDRGANNVSVVKEAMAQLGLCSRAVRPPISELSSAERERVSECLEKLGIGTAQELPASSRRSR
jgi:4-hydroxy-tetrahydrodipicolinate synthase